MFRLSEKVKKIEDKLNAFITKHKSKFPLYITLGLVILYFYGIVVRCIGVGVINFQNAAAEEWFTLNPFKNNVIHFAYVLFIHQKRLSVTFGI